MTKHPGGRPTKYKPEYCQAIIDYFKQEPFTTKIRFKYYKDGSKEEIPYKEPCALPTFEGFALSVGVHRETCLEWHKEHKEFSDAYKQAKDYQKDILIKNGLMNLYAQPFAIFTAKNVTDMKDKQDIGFTGQMDTIVRIGDKPYAEHNIPD